MPFKNKHPLYTVWRSMVERCYNSKTKQYRDYGGRGITVCPQWRYNYKQFIADMAPRPHGLTLERIDNNKGYSPENCKWATRKKQQHNQTVTRKVIIEGIEYIACELGEKYGIKTDTIVERAEKGFPFESVVHRGYLKWYEKPTVTHCVNGHEFTPENTKIGQKGKRFCRICMRLTGQEQYWRANKHILVRRLEHKIALRNARKKISSAI